MLAPGPWGSQGRAGAWARVANSGHCRLRAGFYHGAEQGVGSRPFSISGDLEGLHLCRPHQPGACSEGASEGPFCELMMKGGPGSPRTGLGALSWADTA